MGRGEIIASLVTTLKTRTGCDGAGAKAADAKLLAPSALCECTTRKNLPNGDVIGIIPHKAV